jgi:2-dehydropantoate 2-reductase
VRIAVMGAGAVGGYFGARLAAASHEVSFIGRGKHLEAMRRHGISINSFQGDFHIGNALFTADPADVGTVDLVLLCVKSYDTEEAGQKLDPLIGARTVVLSLQNGVDNADKIARSRDPQRTLAGVVYLGAQILRPALIKHSSGGKIVLGELNGGLQETTQALEGTFTAAGIPCEISREIRKIQWRKLLWNAPFCAIACLTRATAKEIVESPSLTELATDCMNEVLEAAQTLGFVFDPAVIEETLAFSRSLGDFKPSMLQDLEANKPLEYEAFNGIVVDLLRRAGKEAQTNQVFYGALKYLDQRIRAAKSH